MLLLGQSTVLHCHSDSQCNSYGVLAVQVATVQGFVESSAKGFVADATDSMYQQLMKQHNNTKVLPVREIRSHLHGADGGNQEVDGAVVADGCAAILEAKQVLEDTAVTQLTSCIEFIK